MGSGRFAAGLSPLRRFAAIFFYVYRNTNFFKIKTNKLPPLPPLFSSYSSPLLTPSPFPLLPPSCHFPLELDPQGRGWLLGYFPGPRFSGPSTGTPRGKIFGNGDWRSHLINSQNPWSREAIRGSRTLKIF
jgi:hypothetical protein